MNPNSPTVTATPSTDSARARVFRRPAYRVHAEDHGHIVEVLLPGVARGGVEISLHEDVLTIPGTVTPRPTGAALRHRETPPGDFRLPLRLNVAVEQSEIRAEIQDGVLLVRLPKPEERRPRTIEVR